MTYREWLLWAGSSVLVVGAAVSLATYPAARIQLKQLTAELDQEYRPEPEWLNQGRIHDVNRAIVVRADEVGAELVRMKDLEGAQGTLVGEHRLWIEATGGYHTLGAFVASLESLPWQVGLAEVVLERTAGGRGRLSLKLTAPFRSEEEAS